MKKLILKKVGNKKTIQKTVKLIAPAPFVEDKLVEIHIEPANNGIVFKVSTEEGKYEIPADVSHHKKTDGEKTTLIANSSGEVKCVEHLLSALSGAGIDSCRISLNFNQVPVPDASTKKYFDLILKAGLEETKERRTVAIVRETIVFGDNMGSMAIIRPSDTPSISALIQFPEPIGEQYFKLKIDPVSYGLEIAWARSFIRSSCNEKVWKICRKKIPSLPEDVRLSPVMVFKDRKWIVAPKDKQKLEPVRHKILDAIGDLSILGYPILGEISLIRPGHDFNRRLTKHLASLI